MDIEAVPEWQETADIETSSEEYARRFAGAVGAWFLQMQETAMLELLAGFRGARILDVGGGHGQVTGALIRNGFSVAVLSSADVCRQKIQTYVDRGECSFHIGDFLHMPFPDRSFDVVISLRLLSHVNSWVSFLSELTRVADRALILDYTETRSVNAVAPMLFRLKKRIEHNTRPFRMFRDRTLISVLRSLDFESTGRYAQFALPMALHRMIRQPGMSRGFEGLFRATGWTRLFGSPVLLRAERNGTRAAGPSPEP